MAHKQSGSPSHPNAAGVDGSLLAGTHSPNPIVHEALTHKHAFLCRSVAVFQRQLYSGYGWQRLRNRYRRWS